MSTATEPATKAIEVTAVDVTDKMYLREALAEGETGDYEVNWTRIVPMGLHATVKHRKTGKRVSVMVNEKALFEAMSNFAIEVAEAGT